MIRHFVQKSTRNFELQADIADAQIKNVASFTTKKNKKENRAITELRPRVTSFLLFSFFVTMGSGREQLSKKSGNLKAIVNPLSDTF